MQCTLPCVLAHSDVVRQPDLLRTTVLLRAMRGASRAAVQQMLVSAGAVLNTCKKCFRPHHPGPRCRQAAIHRCGRKSPVPSHYYYDTQKQARNLCLMTQHTTPRAGVRAIPRVKGVAWTLRQRACWEANSKPHAARRTCVCMCCVWRDT
jgi:hypothetical protein